MKTERLERSWVWNYFQKQEQGVAVCKFCGLKEKCKNNTTQLNRHLKGAHQIEQTPLIWSVERSNLAKQKMMEVIVQDLRPISLFSSGAMKSFLQIINPAFQIPCPTTISNIINENHNKVQIKMIDELREIHCYSITSDLWTNLSNVHFINTNIHFINRQWELRHKILKVKKLDEESITNEIILEHWEQLFSDYGISGGRKCVVADGGSNIVCASRKLENSCLIHCHAHLLNLIVNGAIKDSKDVLELMEKCKKVVKKIRKSTKLSTAMRNKQSENDIKELKVLKYVETRWNSLLVMIRRLLLLKDVINSVMTEYKEFDFTFSIEECYVMMEIVAMLDPFEQATLMFCEENSVSISRVIPTYYAIQCTLEGKDVKKMIVFKSNLITHLKNRFKEITLIESIATFLDPRYSGMFEKHLIQFREIVLKEVRIISMEFEPNALKPPLTNQSIYWIFWIWMDNQE